MHPIKSTNGTAAEARRIADKASVAIWEAAPVIGMENMRKIEVAILSTANGELKKNAMEKTAEKERLELRIKELEGYLEKIKTLSPKSSKCWEIANGAINSESFISPDAYRVHLDGLRI